MDTKKLNELFLDQAFVKSLCELETAAQVQAELKKKGLDATEQDVMKLRESLIKQIENGKHQGEMSLDQLDDVAGGFGGIDLKNLEPIDFTMLTSPNARW